MINDAMPAGRRLARLRVLTQLGLERLVKPEFLDILEGHRAYAKEQGEPGSFDVEGLRIDAPAGVYHPQANSSSLMFIRNVSGAEPRPYRKVWDLGCGSGAVGLFLASRYGADALATDISDRALATTRANAAKNGLTLRTRRADMFDGVDEDNFDLIIFNAPLIDATPENEWDRDAMCDPGGELLSRFAHQVDRYLAPDGYALTGICCDSAYERLEGAAAQMWVVGMELAGNGFWRAVVGFRK